MHVQCNVSCMLSLTILSLLLFLVAGDTITDVSDENTWLKTAFYKKISDNQRKANRLFPMRAEGQIRITSYIAKNGNHTLESVAKLANETDSSIIVARGNIQGLPRAKRRRESGTPIFPEKLGSTQTAEARMRQEEAIPFHIKNGFHPHSLLLRREYEPDLSTDFLIACRPSYFVLDYELVPLSLLDLTISFLVVTMVNPSDDKRRVSFRKFVLLIPLFDSASDKLRAHQSLLLSRVRHLATNNKRFLVLLNYSDSLDDLKFLKSLAALGAIEAHSALGFEHPSETNWRGVFSDTFLISRMLQKSFLNDINYYYTPETDTLPVCLDLRVYSPHKNDDIEAVFLRFIREGIGAIYKINWRLIRISLLVAIMWTGLIILLRLFFLFASQNISDGVEQKLSADTYDAGIGAPKMRQDLAYDFPKNRSSYQDTSSATRIMSSSIPFPDETSPDIRVARSFSLPMNAPFVTKNKF